MQQLFITAFQTKCPNHKGKCCYNLLLCRSAKPGFVQILRNVNTKHFRHGALLPPINISSNCTTNPSPHKIQHRKQLPSRNGVEVLFKNTFYSCYCYTSDIICCYTQIRSHYGQKNSTTQWSSLWLNLYG